jgi:hypothetical protein
MCDTYAILINLLINSLVNIFLCFSSLWYVNTTYILYLRISVLLIISLLQLQLQFQLHVLLKLYSFQVFLNSCRPHETVHINDHHPLIMAHAHAHNMHYSTSAIGML